MASQLSSRLGCSIIEILSDDGHISFFVHTNLLTAQSPWLGATIPTIPKLDLQSWNSDTVGNLVNFLYLETYNVPHPEPFLLLEASSDTATTTTTTAHSRAHTPDTERGAQQDCTTEPRPLTPVSTANLTVNEGIDCDLAPKVAEGNYYLLYPQETHEYHDFLLAHTRIYALAQSLSFDRLRRLAYCRVSAVLGGLKHITPCSSLASCVVRLLDYVYAHSQHKTDPMRELVSQFAAQNYSVMQRMGAMDAMMRGGGEIAVELMQKVGGRLVAAEDAVEQAHAMPVSLGVATEALRLQDRHFVVIKRKHAYLDKQVKEIGVYVERAAACVKDRIHA